MVAAVAMIVLSSSSARGPTSLEQRIIAPDGMRAQAEARRQHAATALVDAPAKLIFQLCGMGACGVNGCDTKKFFSCTEMSADERAKMLKQEFPSLDLVTGELGASVLHFEFFAAN